MSKIIKNRKELTSEAIHAELLLVKQDTLASKEAADAVVTREETVVADATEQAGIATTKAAEASASAVQAQNNILNGVSTHNSDESSHNDIRQLVNDAVAVAHGRATALVFATKQAMLDWLAIPENIATLITGDNLYIEDVGVPDYWWTGTTYSELEAEAPKLADYYLKTEVDALLPIPISETDYNALVAAGTVLAGRSYDIRIGA